MQIGMFRSDTRVIETCADRIDLIDLSFVVLAEQAFHAMEDSFRSGCNRCCLFCCLHAQAGGFTADQPN
ncbi:hypothetical protein SDC9_166126 [bioreactor metagenome]|uniref:Uncharacterized protein n=1 Tax=bioreactor metagenome TaxID=1076179 RepID=A0A645G413_9ZZZZ